MVRYVFPLQRVSATKCSIIQNGFHCGYLFFYLSISKYCCKSFSGMTALVFINACWCIFYVKNCIFKWKYAQFLIWKAPNCNLAIFSAQLVNSQEICYETSLCCSWDTLFFCRVEPSAHLPEHCSFKKYILKERNSVSVMQVAFQPCTELAHTPAPPGRMSGLAVHGDSPETALAEILTRWMNSSHLKDLM